jgi:hypothetical protein
VTIRNLLGGLALMALSSFSHAAWTHAHGDSDNRGFAKVITVPATIPTGFADVGEVAPGANPVTATDGTVYIGNVLGELIALHANGTAFWKRKLNLQHGAILASPVIGADGSIYVVSTAVVREHQTGTQITRYHSYLHKFSPSGAWLYWVEFPTQYAVFPQWRNTGIAAAPPNIWRANGVEAILVPTLYKGLGGRELRLIAFSTSLAVLADKSMGFKSYGDLTGSDGLVDWGVLWDFLTECVLSLECGFQVPANSLSDFDKAVGWPSPGVAIEADAKGAPLIWASDWVQDDTAGYTFDGATQLAEVFRFHDAYRSMSSPPVALPGGNVVIGTGSDNVHGSVVFDRQGVRVGGFFPIVAAPTRLPDGRLTVVTRDGRAALLNGTSVVMQDQLSGHSIASAAASCTHLFVASENELVTYDLKNMLAVARLPWTDGGRYAPVIGPAGYVYGMTTHGLFVFPPPKRPALSFVGTACANGATAQGGFNRGLTFNGGASNFTTQTAIFRP